MDQTLIVSSSPHIKTGEDTRSIMLDVCVALLFPLAIAVFLFGWRALLLTLTSVAACVLFEWLYRKLLRKPGSIRDLSAVVTGLLLAYNLPVTVPYWLPVVGAFFAIVIVKQLYGGLGKNFMNPALAARAFLFSWPLLMTTWAQPGTQAGLGFSPMTDVVTGVDVLTGATPLASLKAAKLPDIPLSDMFLGRISGCMGEVSVVVLLLGGVYLVVRRVITPRIPVCYLGTVAALTYLFPRGGVPALDWMLYNLMSGGLVLAAVFMATDYTTSPVTKRGQVIFGIGCGLLTVFIRYFGGYPEGVTYSILIMNACAWLIDKVGQPRRFGTHAFARRGGGSTAS